MAASPNTERSRGLVNSAEPPLQGSSSGYEIRSRIRFRTLRDRNGGLPLHVRHEVGLAPDGELIAEWLPRPGNPFHGRLVQSDRTFAFWANDAGWYVVDPAEPSVTIAPPADGLTLTAEVRMFGVPSSLIALERGDLSMHAAAVEIAGQAVLLAGPSRYGKTTLAAAFATAGHRLLTEDMTRCTMVGGASVFPGPAVMRLRPDVAEGFRVPLESHAVTERERVFVILGGSLRGSGAAVPLAAILFLRQGEERLELEPVSTVDAIRDLWTLTFSLPTDASRAAVFERVTDLVAHVPVLDLRRELRLETLPEVVLLVEQFVASGSHRLST
jgi:hypothetical protein